MNVNFMNDDADSILEIDLSSDQISVLKIVDSFSINGDSYKLQDIDFEVDTKTARVWLKSY